MKLYASILFIIWKWKINISLVGNIWYFICQVFTQNQTMLSERVTYVNAVNDRLEMMSVVVGVGSEKIFTLTLWIISDLIKNLSLLSLVLSL